MAGAGVVDHVHLQVVPRWGGDTNVMPVLADVKVLPEHLAETAAGSQKPGRRETLGGHARAVFRAEILRHTASRRSGSRSHARASPAASLAVRMHVLAEPPAQGAELTTFIWSSDPERPGALSPELTDMTLPSR